MKNNIHSASYYIYEVENVPDHRCRRFGCCPSEMTIRTLTCVPYLINRKAALSAGTPNTANAK